MEVKVNFNGVFANINTPKELKETTQCIFNQIKAAYDTRLAELVPTKEETAPVVKTTPSTTQKGKTPAKTKKTTKENFNGAPEADTEKTAPKKITKETAPKNETKTVQQVKISSLTKKQIAAMNIKFERYSEKCMFLTGETKPIKDEIKAIGGAHWNAARKGWFVKNDSAVVLAKALKIKLA